MYVIVEQRHQGMQNATSNQRGAELGNPGPLSVTSYPSDPIYSS
jgi:hypothetical protein